MVSTNEFKTGMTIEMDNNLFSIMEFLHVKPGKGSAFVRTKLRNLRTGGVIEHTFNSGVKVKKAHVEKFTMQYLYNTGDAFVFMNNETYDQIEIPATNVTYEKNFLVESMNVIVIMYGQEVIGIELPDKVTLEVVKSEPAVKGNTSQNATKAATLESGYEVQVPLFIKEGEKLIISTKDGKYVSRA